MQVLCERLDPHLERPQREACRLLWLAAAHIARICTLALQRSAQLAHEGGLDCFTAAALMHALAGFCNAGPGSLQGCLTAADLAEVLLASRVACMRMEAVLPLVLFCAKDGAQRASDELVAGACSGVGALVGAHCWQVQMTRADAPPTL